ncbi:MAG: zinc-dependent metalloprotease family protein, partial [Planctomycetota bacterium]
SAIVIDMYFVEIVPGFDDIGENFVNGLAFISAPGVAVHIGNQILSFDQGPEIVARVVAHEIGHNLGLLHVGTEDKLMEENGRGENLTQPQINQAQNSDLSIPI